MGRWLQGLAWLLVAGLAVVVAADTVLLRGLQRRVGALEAELATLPAAGLAPVVRAGAARPSEDAAREERREAFDKVLRERIEAVLADSERRREDDRGARFQEVLDTQIEDWATAEHVDEATVATVKEELNRRAELFRALRQEVRDGSLSLLEARDEIEASRAASDAVLQRALGPQRFTSLEDEVLSRMGPPGPGAGPPPP